jgi:starch synthase
MTVKTIIISPGHGGGADNGALYLSQELQKTIKIDIASMSDKSKGDVKKIPALKIPFLKGFTNFLVLPLLPAIDLKACNIVHIHNTHPAIAVFLVALYCKLLGVPYVITTHGLVETSTIPQRYGLEKGFKKLIYNFLVRWPLSYSLRNASSVAALCKFETKYLTTLYGVKKEKIHFIYNGYTPKWGKYISQKIKTNEEEVRKRFSLPKDKQIILFVGNIKPNKGIDILLKSTKYIEGKNYQIVIVGKPVFDSYYKLLQEIIKRGKIKDRVVLTGFVTDEELAILYQLSSMFILPTKADTLPLVILDAMFFAKPVVASNVGGIPEEVVDGETSFLVSPGKPKKLAAAINKLLTDQVLAKKMGQAGQSRVQNLFTWPKAAQKTIKIYKEVIRNEGQG